jgi:Cu/Ag efflux pump CusA
MSNAPTRRGQSPLLGWLQRGYDRTLGRIVQSARPAYAAVAVIVVAALVAGAFVLPSVGQQPLLPTFKEPYLTIQLEGPPGTSRQAMDQMVAQASQELRTIPGVRNVGGHVGRAVFGDQVVGINSAQLWVSLDPAANYDATVAAVQAAVDGFEGLDRQVSTYVQQTLSRPQTSASGITVRVFGEDHAILRDEAEKVRQAISGIAGVADPRVLLPVEEPTLEIEVDLASAQSYGIKPGDVRRAAAILLSGLQVGSLFEQQKVFDVVVWGVPEIRESVSDVSELLIETPGGEPVRLGDVADVRLASAPIAIQREAISPYLDVVFNVAGRDAAAVTRDVQAALQSFPFSLEYHAQVMDDYAARQAAEQRVLLSAAVAAVGIFLLLQAAYGSWRLAALAFVTLPAALAGGALAALLVGGAQGVSLSSLFGFITVLGIAARNGIMMIGHFQQLEKESERFGPELVVRGAGERLAPILTTTIITALALLPFVLFGDVPGLEVVRPMALVILGGLVTSTLLDLFVVPILYLRFGASREPAMEFSPEPAMAS